MECNKIPFHEIDFLLPVHRFAIEFSYVAKRGLPFIREFALRLIHLAPMAPESLARYLDLSSRELKEVLRDLVDKDELTYCDDGLIDLTPRARGYFVAEGDSPQVTSVETKNITLSFELAGFNCIGKNVARDGWHAGISVPVSGENRGLSDKYASKGFQAQFYHLLELGYMPDIAPKDAETLPSIYKMDAVTRVGQGNKRLPHTFCLDDFGHLVEREDLDAFKYDEPVFDAITRAINKFKQANNLPDVADAMQVVGDNVTGGFISSSGIDVSSLIREIARSREHESKLQLMLGPIYQEGNWQYIKSRLSSELKELKEHHQDGVKELTWLAPSDSFWGKSDRYTAVKSWLEESAMTTGNNPKRLFRPKFYYPIARESDHRGIKEWQNLLTNKEHCYKYIEGFLKGTTEVLLLQGSSAVVCYHLSIPSVSTISIPLAFYTNDKALVNTLEVLLKDYLSGTVGFENPIGLGKL